MAAPGGQYEHNENVASQHISNDDWIYRWVPTVVPAMLSRSSDGEGLIIGPTSAAFSPDTDGTSVFLESALSTNSLGAVDIIHAATDSVWAISVGEVRELSSPGDGVSFGLDVVMDPFPQDVDDPEHPRYIAHALIIGLLELGKKPQHRARKSLSTAQSLKCVYLPDGVRLATAH